MYERLKILFLCTGNSCRSQMAEGFACHFYGDRFDVFSAGTEVKGLNPFAVKVMKEVGIDISNQYSKTIQELTEKEFDYVITLCDDAAENCPVFLARVKLIHHPFDDPPKFAAGVKTENEILFHYRRVRDEICKYIEMLPAILKTK
jgi:arsenate reductase (thioredoxin)